MTSILIRDTTREEREAIIKNSMDCGGDAYLTGLATRNRVSATFAGGGCAFAFDFVPAGLTQPDLGTFTCTS